ncbi:MAG: hypothetical protein ABRQ38_24860 [Candidatus Eremiobacterota bacterium]
MIRNDREYNQIRLFIRYVVGRKSPQKLISYIRDQLLFHDKMDLSYTPDGITLRVSLKGKDNFVPLGEIQDPTCIVYLSIIGATMFASSHSSYVKRIDLVRHLRLKDENEKNVIKPELQVIIPNMAPYIKRLNERLGYKAIRNKKIGREAGYFFETENFRGKQLVPYHMDKRKFTCTWSKGNKVLFFTHPDCDWEIVNYLKTKNIWSVPVYYKKELKNFAGKFNPKLIIFDGEKRGDELDLFGMPPVEDNKIPFMNFFMRDDGTVEIWNEEEKNYYKDIEEFSEYLSHYLSKIKQVEEEEEEEDEQEEWEEEFELLELT